MGIIFGEIKIESILFIVQKFPRGLINAKLAQMGFKTMLFFNSYMAIKYTLIR